MEYGRGFKIVRMVDLYRGNVVNDQGLDRVEYPRKPGDEYSLAPGDILINRTSVKREGVAKASLTEAISETTFFDCSIIRARPNTAVVDPDYLLRALNGPAVRVQVMRIAKTATITTVSQPGVRGLLIPLPPPSEQRRIVEILDQVDAIREKRAEADKLAERILPALFYDMFGDPAANPRDWPINKLDDLCELVTDGTHDTPKPIETGIDGFPLVTNKDFVGGRLRFENAYLISAEEHLRVIARSKPEYGDVLFSQIGTLGIACYVDTRREFSIKNCALFKPNPGKLSGRWLASLFNAPSFRTSVLASSSGGLQKYLSLGTLRSILVPTPPIEVQRQFEQLVDSTVTIAENVRAAGDGLQRLAAVLSHRAFSGELTAKWREKNKALVEKEMAEQKRLLAAQQS